MKRVSVKFKVERVEELDSIADDEGVSRSELIRNLVDDALNTGDDERVHELEERIQELERDKERLQNEKELILEQRDEHTELVRHVEQKRTLVERRARASLFTRAKWWFTGMDDDEPEASD